MTTKTTTKHPYDRALPIAEALAERLAPHCQRIEIAGSLRRKADMIGDVELVAIPKFEEVEVDLFGDTRRRSLLDAYLEARLAEGSIAHAPHKRWGEKMKAFTFESTAGETYKVDLFIQPDPATWGVNFLLRTGPAKFSHAMVTAQSKGGLRPDKYEVSQARVWEGSRALSTPAEEDVFRLWRLEYPEPWDRDRVPEAIQP